VPPVYFADTAFWLALLRKRDQHHVSALHWESIIRNSRGRIVTTEAVLWEWLNAVSDVATRQQAATGYDLIRRDPRIDVVPHGPELGRQAIEMYSARVDKAWSITDCPSFVVMRERGIAEALTSDHHFAQCGFVALMA
jgi:uncharacterized protein